MFAHYDIHEIELRCDVGVAMGWEHLIKLSALIHVYNMAQINRIKKNSLSSSKEGMNKALKHNTRSCVLYNKTRVEIPWYEAFLFYVCVCEKSCNIER